jgi:hypothetical protein
MSFRKSPQLTQEQNVNYELPSFISPPPTAVCLLHLRGVRVGGRLCRYRTAGHNVIFSSERGNLSKFKVKERSGNVIENTYSYMLKAVMLLKTNVVSVW